MMKKSVSLVASMGLLIISISSCLMVNTRKEYNYTHGKNEYSMSPTLGGKLFSSAWIQRSAEYKALCQQAYNIATLRLDEAIAKGKPTKPWAIITDIDETILDNTPNSVHQSLKGEDYTDSSWDKWCDLAEADTLAGSRDFFCKASEAGVEIFYISNRNEKNRKGTLENLQKFGFPQVDNEHLILRGQTSDKSARRAKVLEKYNILMLIGDNLGDFEHIFDSKSEQERQHGFESYKAEFGRKFIVLPNPNYGTWEKAMNDGYPALNIKDQLLTKKKLKSHR